MTERQALPAKGYRYVGILIALALWASLIPFDLTARYECPRLTPVDDSLVGLIVLKQSSVHNDYCATFVYARCKSMAQSGMSLGTDCEYGFDGGNLLAGWSSYYRGSKTFRALSDELDRVRSGAKVISEAEMTRKQRALIDLAGNLYSQTLLRNGVPSLVRTIFGVHIAVFLLGLLALLARESTGRIAVKVVMWPFLMLRTLLVKAHDRV